ncbi:MAG: hypothetical protein HYY63_03515, partial [Elusimicrobia bacterium]|nr:hypothetical protein [Elusimicrobiota bacterium]
KVISTTIAFNSLTVTPSTITPDNDGTNDLATITFQPTNPDVFWRVRIGTDPILSQTSQLSENVLRASTINVLFDFFGSGYPQGLTWYGSDFMGDIVPSSTNPFTTPRYIVRVEDAGGAIVSTTSMGVQSHYLDVFVTSTTGSSIGIENAYVTVNGQSGRGYVSRTKRTGANGRAQIWGLKGGSEYTVSVNYFDPNTNVEFSGTLSGRSAGNPPASISTVTFSQPTEIRIHAFIPQSAVQSSFDQWGFANVANNANGSPVGFRSLRFPSGSSESDSGYSFTGLPSSWTTVSVPANTAYTIRAELRGFGSTETVVNVTTGTTDVLFTFSKKPQVFGYVVLPSTQQFGTWVSVEGIKSGSRFPTTFGGAFISGINDFREGRTTGSFVLDMDTGTYTIKARAFGIGSVSLNNILVTSTGIGSILSGEIFDGSAILQDALRLAFSTSVANGIAGTIRVEGDTSQLSNISGGSFTLSVNAFSPINYSYAYAQIQLPQQFGDNAVASSTYRLSGLEDGLYQVHTFLDGFETDPPGPKNVLVSGGVGNLNITLKRYTGRITANFGIYPSTDFANIALRVQGPGVQFSTPSIYGMPGFASNGSTATIASPNIG